MGLSSASFSLPTMDEHHVHLSDPEWTLWRWSILRGAGFPTDLPLRLSAPECAAAADALLAAEEVVGRTRRAAVAQMKALRGTSEALRKPLTNAIHLLYAQKLPQVTEAMPSDIIAAITAVAASQAQVAAAHQDYVAIFAHAVVATTEALRECVATEPFRQALAWQNRQALHTANAQFLSKPATTTTSHYRQHRLLLAKYLQRYALKNDTIGFFGPVGWARWQPEQPHMVSEPGETLLAQRTTYLEGWAINALSQRFTADPRYQIWAKPRLMPFVRVEGTTLHIPFAPPQALTPAEVSVLAACTGVYSAHAIAQRLLVRGIPGLTTPADVYAVLVKLQQQRRIAWSFDVSLEAPFPEHVLRHNLAEIGDLAARKSALASLAELVQARDAITAATHNADDLDRAIGKLEDTFTALTDQSATRSAGKLYAGRTLIYEDSLRAGTVSLGADLLRALDLPLQVILTSARWLSYHLADIWRRHCRAIYAKLVQQEHTDSIEFIRIFPLFNATLYESAPKLFAPLRAEFQQKWADILAPLAGQSHMQVAARDIAARVAQAFAAPGPTWPSAHFHCPDLMIAATDVAAINRGDYQFVMGELHMAMNTLDGVVFSQQHPRVADFQQALAADLPQPLVLPLSSEALIPSTRLHPSSALPKDFRLLTIPANCDAPPNKILRSADLVVYEQGDTLMVQTRDGQHSFEIMEVLSEYFALVATDYFALFPAQPHSPRLTIDNVVVSREAWRKQADELDFLKSTDAAEGFIAVRRWAQAQHLPRYLFYRTVNERKPCFLDLTSPLYVDLFLKEVRGAVNAAPAGANPARTIVTFSEMLPTPEQAWLMDAQGAHYTSEIRIAAVDGKRA